MLRSQLWEGQEKASMTHISWLQSLRLKYLRTAEDKCTLAIFSSEDKIHTLCWAWKEQQGGKELENHHQNNEGPLLFFNGKKTASFHKRNQSPERKQITKRRSTVVLESVIKLKKLRSSDSQSSFHVTKTASLQTSVRFLRYTLGWGVWNVQRNKAMKTYSGRFREKHYHIQSLLVDKLWYEQMVKMWHWIHSNKEK